MSSKKLTYFLTVLLVCGLIATGTAHAQIGGIGGTVSDPDGTPVVGVVVEAPGFGTIQTASTTDADGTYFLPYISFANVVIKVGDTITVQVTDTEGYIIERTHTVTAADTAAGTATFDITLSALSIAFEKAEVPADGVSTSQITVTGADPGDTITISATQGSVSAVTENADGTYTATYTAPSLALRAPLADQITVRSGELDQERTGAITLTVVPTVVDVTVAPNTFTADTPGTGDITITVKRGTDLISDETVTVGLSRGDGKSDTGTIGAVTNNGDGTYSATYASGGVVGSITLTATATQANVRGTASITVNAGPPTEISLRTLPDTVSSYGSAIITATVRDAAGNGVGGLMLSATTSSGGALTPFVADATQFGRYTATYTAPVVEVAGTEMITATIEGISAERSLTLNPVPPKEVGIIIVRGTVYKEGGEVPVSGIDVAVTIGANPAQTKTTGADGTFSVSILNPVGVAARTGDIVTIVATDDTGERGAEEFVLTNELLEDDDNPDDAVVTQDVITDITATSPNLVVEGTVFLEDGLTAATSLLREGGLTVTVTNTTRNLSATTSADSAGRYDVTFFDPSSIVAETGDEIAIEVQNDAGEAVGTGVQPLTTAQVDAGRANIDVTTHFIADSVSLAVFGTVFLEDGLTAAASLLRDDDLTVIVTNADRNNIQGSGAVRDDGGYTATLFNPPDIVAQTGDELTVNVEVQNSAGETVGPPTPHTLTTAEVAAQRAELNLTTDLIATSEVLVVSGTVFLKNGDGDRIPATKNFVDGSLAVVVTNTDIDVEGTGIVRDDGNYTVTLFNPPPDVAATDHQLMVEVRNDAGEVVGTTNHTLTTAEVAATRANDINVQTELLARINSLFVRGSVIELNGSPAGAGLVVKLTLVMNGNGEEKEVPTDSAGNYEWTFFDTEPVVATGDKLVVTVSRADGFHGRAEIKPLRSSAIVYQNQPLMVAPIKMLPPVKALGGLSLNPQHVPEELKRISRDAIERNPTLLDMLPSGILYLDLLKGQLPDLPIGFDPLNNAIDKENFGNAITPRPIWHVLGEGQPTDPGRWFNGDLLNLYVLTGPTADSVRFTLSGAGSDRASAKRIAAGANVPYTFQLEEERAVLFLPSWDGSNEVGESVFASVDLMIDEQPAPISMMRGDGGVWSAEAELPPGSPVHYYYQVTLAQAYQVEGKTVETWAMPDPRNLQVQDRGIVETLLAPELGPNLVEIVTTMDLKLRSVFNVPRAHTLQRIWVHTFDLSNKPEGMYQVDTTISHAGTVDTNDPAYNNDYIDFEETIGAQMFTVDRSAPTADLTIKETSGMYSPGAGQYVAAAKSEDATLTLSANPTGDPMDPGAYLYQIISLDEAGNPGANVWHPAIKDLPLTYMDPHTVTLPIGVEDMMGHFGLRAAGIDSILNISSMIPPTLLELVPPDPDNAAVTVVHADYNGDGTADGRFESVQNVSDGVTIFSDRSTVTLTLKITDATKHPLTQFDIDFQINGEGDWKPIKHHTAAELAELSKLNEEDELPPIHWDRTEDFADLLDMRGQATVRVTVANALDVVRNDSIATFEIIPPALRLGGLSINAAGATAQLEALQAGLGLMDLNALVAGANAELGEELIPPALLPVALSIFQALAGLQLLPSGFELDDENIDQENFGNGLTPRPTWYPIASADQQDDGRWVNGNQLQLYTLAGPTAESVTFMLNGAPAGEADKVTADGFHYTFQLEEELVGIFAAGIPDVFASVQLVIEGHDAPIDMERGSTGIWSVDVPLTANSKVYYYYIVELAKPYHDPLNDITITEFPLTAQQLQLADVGFAGALDALLMSNLDSLSTMDPGLRSVFTVPAVDDDSQSLWVGKIDFAPDADGAYQLDVAVEYGSGSTDELTGKMFTVDRTAPTADAMLHLDAPGQNVGMYMRADGSYVAAALMPKAGSITFSAIPTGDDDLEAYMYQLARLDANGYPDAWNPVLTPNELLPLTFPQGPHQVQMLIQNDAGSNLIGSYGLRVVGIDSILNADSGRGATAVVDLVPPDPDSAMVSLVQADYDGDGTMDGPYETQAADGATIFSDSMVTLTVKITERTDHPLMINLEYQVAGGDWHSIGMLNEEATNAMAGDQLPVNWHVGDYAELPNTTGHVMVRTVATNGLTIERTSEVSLAYERRLAPAIAAIHVEAADLHPTSNAPRGGITLSAVTQAMTNPKTTAIQFEIRRAADTDADWQPIGVAQLLGDTTVVSNVQTPLIEDLIGTIVAGAPSAPLSSFYRQWSISVDTTALEDTILDGTAAETDASQDDNPYVVQATAVDVAGMGYPAVDGVGADFSVDNYSPTEITQVDNEVETVEPDENGNYYVSGLIAEDVPAPMRKLTAWTGAYPGVFPGGIKLVVNDADSGAAVEIPDTIFGAEGNYTYIGDFQLASVENGVYTFKAVAYTADGMAEERIVARPITVEVRNFNPLTDILSVIVIDTEGEARTSSEIDTMYPIGFPAVEDKFTFTLTTNHVHANEIDVMIGDDGDSARMLAALTDDGIMVTANADGSTSFEITLDTSMLDDGRFNLTGTITKPNGSAPFDLPGIRVDRTAPVVEIVSPIARAQLTAQPTIQVTYSDASGFDPNDMAMEEMPVVITLTRLPSGEVIDIVEGLIHITAAADGEIQTQMGNIVYTHGDPLPGGAYRIEATVTDILGNVGSAEPVEVTVEGVKPTVSVMSPLSGQIVDPRQPLIVSVALTGSGDLTVTEFQINGTDIEGTLEDNWLTYTMQPPLVDADDSILQRGSDNTISVKIVDSEGYTAENGISFAVSLDNTPPVISGPAPKGDITRKLGRITARVSDNESNITRIQFALDDNPLQDISFSSGRVVEVGKGTEVQGQTNFNFFDAPLGTHSVTIVAESTGGTSTLTWEFTIVSPDSTPPKVVTYSPLGIIRTDRPILAATVSDESGFKRDGITLILAGVPGNQGSGRRSSPTSTTVTFTPSISVTPGPYTARLTVIDKYNNRTEAEWQFTVELDSTPPAITTTSPHGVIQVDKPVISVSASDDMSGVDTIDISVKNASSQAVAGVTSIRSDKTSATFTPTQALTSGTYTVDVKLADMSGNKASGQWQFTVELDTVAPIVLDTRPSQEHTENRRPVISATYTDTTSGVDIGSVKLTLDGSLVEPDTLSDTQVTFTPKADLPFGSHTVKLEVSDMAPSANTAVQEWTFYVERVGIANARNYPNPFEEETTIAFRVSRQASITIRIYDFTGRLVAQPVANARYEAGEVKIDWHNETTAGDHLARGVYFCHILMEDDNFESQSAILKMAIISE